MPELPEEHIEFAESSGAIDHVHDPALGADDSLLVEHLRSVHNLEAPDDLSTATLQGLHDRMHGTSDAIHLGR